MESVQAIIDEVAQKHCVDVSLIMCDCRYPEVVRARWEIMQRLHVGGLSHSQIGRILGKNHTTVMYGLRQVQS